MARYGLTAGDLTNLVPRRKRETGLVAYKLTELQRLARRKRLGEGEAALTAPRLRAACAAAGVDGTGPPAALRRRLHEALDPYASQSRWVRVLPDEVTPSIVDVPWASRVTKRQALELHADGAAGARGARGARVTVAEDDLTFLVPHEKRNPYYGYGAPMLLYEKVDLLRVLSHKRARGAKVLGLGAVRAVCAALGVPTAAAGHGAALVGGQWRGGAAELTKQQMLRRARVAIDPRGRITRARQRA